jgi:hypothetical protein
VELNLCRYLWEVYVSASAAGSSLNQGERSMTTFNDTVEAPVFQTIGGKAVVRGDNGGLVRLFHPVALTRISN